MAPVGERRRVFITVKTYPTISKKYDELVCTAGILDGGHWARIYPLPFRKLEYEKRYRKFQWMEFDLVKNTTDPRPESYRIENIECVKPIGPPVGTEQGWHKRKEIIFAANPIYDDLAALIEKANKNELSIAIFKPTKVCDLTTESVSREWSQEKIDLLRQKARQMSLFQYQAELEKELMVVDKLPYKFSYKFIDSKGRAEPAND